MADLFDAAPASVRSKNGKFKVSPTPVVGAMSIAVGAVIGALMDKLEKSERGTAWGMLFGLLFFIPVFEVDRGFRNQVRDMPKPGMSACFPAVEQVTRELSLSKGTESEPQDALHRSAVPVGA